MIKQKIEAIERMYILDLHKDVVIAFTNQDIIFQSVQGRLCRIDDQTRKELLDWQIQTGNLVYHVIHNVFQFGECLSILFVSKYEDEWECERIDLENGVPLVYVRNIDDDWRSEYGSIRIKLWNHAIVRTA